MMWRVQIFLLLTLAVLAGPAAVLAEEPLPSLQFWNQTNPNLGASARNNAQALDTLFDLPQKFYRKVDRHPDPQQNGWLGIGFRKVEPGAAEDPAGTEFEITRVFPGSPADRSGLRQGDRILVSMDGLKEGVDATLHFRKQVAHTGAGEVLSLEILRDDQRIQQKITLDQRPLANTTVDLDPDREQTRGRVENSLLHHVLMEMQAMERLSGMLHRMRVQADTRVSTSVQSDQDNPFRLSAVTRGLHRPFDLPGMADAMVRDVNPLVEDNGNGIARAVQSASHHLDLPADASAVPVTVSGWRDYFMGLQQAVLAYTKHQNEIQPQARDVERIRQWVEHWVEALKRIEDSPSGIKHENETSTLDFLHAVLKTGWMQRPLNASGLIQAMQIPWLLAQQEAGLQDLHFPDDWSLKYLPDRIEAQTPIGKVIVGGPQNTIYSSGDEAVILIDLGGDDVYFNRAGGASPGHPVSILIDLSGDDRYLSDESFSQGAGLFGAGILIDLKGDDQYMACDLAQGVGVLGIGLLFDHDGHDRYHCSTFCQGAATVGVGLLGDRKGKDDYRADLFAQGAGMVKGFGGLVDGQGNDRYHAGGLVPDFRQPDKATQSFAQGFGFGIRPFDTPAGASGGIGLLSDGEGHDTYIADYFAQGSSYWLALGILSDTSGHDRYFAGRYSQGAGIHVSLGLLQDGSGDDLYDTHFGVSQGLGHDFGVGFLLDHGGSDRYRSDVMAQGAGNANGLGVLNDNGGDDEYQSRSESQGRGHHDPIRDLGSYGFLFDTGGGNDLYSSGKLNRQITTSGPFGVAADTD